MAFFPSKLQVTLLSSRAAGHVMSGQLLEGRLLHALVPTHTQTHIYFEIRPCCPVRQCADLDLYNRAGRMRPQKQPGYVPKELAAKSTPLQRMLRAAFVALILDLYQQEMYVSENFC